MRFIHTSDWHIGRQFHNVSLLDDQAFILEQIVELLQTHACDALVIAGDLYDRSVPPATAVELMDKVFHQHRSFVDRQMMRLLKVMTL